MFEYNGLVYRDLEPQVRYNAECVESLKKADIALNNKIDNLPTGGTKVVVEGENNGNLTDEQLNTLKASESNYIENNNEIYLLMDNGATEGYLTYSHVGIENSKQTVKTITITENVKSWVKVVQVIPTDAGGGKLYRHEVTIDGSNPDGPPSSYSGVQFQGRYWSTSITSKTMDDFWNNDPGFGWYHMVQNVNGNSKAFYSYTVFSKDEHILAGFFIKADGTDVIYNSIPTTIVSDDSYTYTISDIATEV